VAPLEPWEKVLVDAKFLESEHAKQDCTVCHGGVQLPEKDAAHAGLIPNPDQGEGSVCTECHAEQAATFATSLHATQQGYWTVLDARSVPENHPALETMFGNHCASCHTTCSDCHISQPESVGGGLFSGHLFEKTPPMTRSCTACHGSRVGNEFLGKNEGFPGDVHFREARMNCVKCHSGADMHGVTPEGVDPQTIDHRYAGPQSPTCESCHPQVVDVQAAQESGIEMHAVHSQNLSCQVCHSVTYTSCDGCHVAISETSGNPFFETEATYPTFLIGVNSRQSEERPHSYVPVRHVPVSPDSFAYYGEDLLPNFNALPTWAYATPHNIQLSTPQNQSCESCHANPDLFLTADKVNPDELEANQAVIVQQLPPDLTVAGKPQPADHVGRAVCVDCHETGVAEATIFPEDHAGRSDAACYYCHLPPQP